MDYFRVCSSLVQSGVPAAKAMQMARTASYAQHIRTTTPKDAGAKLIAVRDKYKLLHDESVATGGRPFYRYVPT